MPPAEWDPCPYCNQQLSSLGKCYTPGCEAEGYYLKSPAPKAKTMSWPVKIGAYTIVPADEPEVYNVIKGDSTAYVVTRKKDWNGARCSCPPVKFHKKMSCKHQDMVNEALTMQPGQAMEWTPHIIDTGEMHVDDDIAKSLGIAMQKDEDAIVLDSISVDVETKGIEKMPKIILKRRTPKKTETPVTVHLEPPEEPKPVVDTKRTDAPDVPDDLKDAGF